MHAGLHVRTSNAERSRLAPLESDDPTLPRFDPGQNRGRNVGRVAQIAFDPTLQFMGFLLKIIYLCREAQFLTRPDPLRMFRAALGRRHSRENRRGCR